MKRAQLTPLLFKRRAAELFGSKIGVVCGDRRFTYGEFAERIDRFSRALVQLGVRPGDRVAFLSYNCHRLLEAYYGVVQMGAILQPLNIRLSARELAFILNDAEASVLFLDPEFIELVERFRSELRTVKMFIALDEGQEEKWLFGASYENLLTNAAGEPPVHEIDEDDVAELFYTSGTTGDPKGVMLTHRNIYLHTLSVLAAYPAKENEPEIIQLHTIPLFHVNGWGTPQTVTCVGGKHVMLKRFDPATVLQLIERERVTRFSLVPTMANALLNFPDLEKYDCSSVVSINLGGAAPTVEMVKALEEQFDCEAFAGYGLTETSPVLTLSVLKSTLRHLPPEEQLRRKAMTGLPIPGVELRVVDERGRDIPHDGRHMGEIIVRSGTVMKGYWRRPEDTARVIKDGWFYTGDMATIDEEGYVLIVDRKKDIIISGGENISSIEVEKVIASHPAVFECAVIPVPDDRWGEVPQALVVVKPGHQLSERELIEYCRARLAHFKVPKSVEFRPSLPKGGTGKILKRELKEEYWRGHERRVH